MSLISVPQRATAKPRRVASFDCYTWILIQVTGAGNVILAQDSDELLSQLDAGLQDGLILTAAGTVVPFGTWWKGDLWAAGSVATTFVLLAPGSTNNANNTGGGGGPLPA